jgi:hypothetical protein
MGEVEAMDPMSPTNMHTNDRHVCIGTSFNNHHAQLLLFDGNVRLGNELLTGWGQNELGKCLSQGLRFFLGQEKDRASERIAAVFDRGDLRFDLVDGQEFDGDAA